MQRLRSLSQWSLLTASGVTAACYSPSLPTAADSDTESPQASSSGTTNSPTGPSDGTEDDAGSSIGSDPTPGESTIPGDGTMSESESESESESVDGSTAVECTVADDCGPGELCIDSACGPCEAAADPDGACAEDSAETPFCEAGVGCVACTPSVCTGDTPACDPAVGCVPCTEHSQCPDSACHLGGPDEGSCFAVADVVEVANAAEFIAAFGALDPGDQRVLHVTGSIPGLGSYSVAGVEIAIIGLADAELMGGFTNFLTIPADALMYVSNVSVSDGSYRAFNNFGGLWLDDVDVSSFTIGVLNRGALRLRRSRLTATGSDAIALHNFDSGWVYAENSALGPGAPIGLLVDDNTTVDLRYVTIAGNLIGVDCGSGVSGTVRNSIVVGASGTFGSSITGCNALAWVDNGVDAAVYGELIGDYDSGWFVNPTAGDFHLTAAGVAAIGNIADWDEGDPIVDIDGDLRPTTSEGRPGLDEP